MLLEKSRARVRAHDRPGSGVKVATQLLLVLIGSFVLGGATSYAQTYLPQALVPFANSASGWTLLTAILVAACRAKTLPSAVFGAVSFVALVLGYQVVSGLRGFPTSEEFFLVAGVVVGPFVGVAASWLWHHGWRAVLGCGLLAGIAVGEGIYGLLLISDTTGWVYWTAIGIVGLALLAFTMGRRLHRARERVVVVGLVAAVSALFYFAYSGAGSVSM